MPRFSFLHLNCHLFRGTYVAALYTKLQYDDVRRCDAICDFVQGLDPDVVVLSEVWGDWMKQRIVDRFSGTHHSQWIPRGLPGCCLKVGPEFVVLSKFAITDFDWIELNDLSGFDRFSKKGVGRAHLAGVCDVYFSHFESADGNMKAANLEQAIALMQSKSPIPTPIVFAGDLNVQELMQVGQTALAPEYMNLRDRLGSIQVVDTYRQLYPDVLAFPGATMDKDANQVFRHFNQTETGAYRIDYIFSRGLAIAEANVHIQNTLADHYPVSATFETL